MQAQKRMEAMQDALSGEQRLYTDKIARDRMEIQRSKEQVLEDQKAALASIYENRSKLAEDRARVEALQKSFQEQKHRDVLQTATVCFFDRHLFFTLDRHARSKLRPVLNRRWQLNSWHVWRSVKKI